MIISKRGTSKCFFFMYIDLYGKCILEIISYTSSSLFTDFLIFSIAFFSILDT